MRLKKIQKIFKNSLLFYILLCLACLLMAGIFISMGLWRFIDGDEGHFIFSGKLVLEGKTPYTDFFYQQMPVMPYLYAAWFWLTGVSWHSARMLASLLSIGSGLLLGWCAYKEIRQRYAAVFALLLFTASGLILCWLPLVKVHSVSFFLLLAGYALWSHWPEPQRGAIRLLAGVLIALSVNVRLMMLVVIPACYLDLWLQEKQQQKWRQAAYFTLGLLLGCAMDFYFLASCPECFLFDNIGYHTIRSSAGFIADFDQKLSTLLDLTGLNYKFGLGSLQQLILTFSSLAYYIYMLKKKRFTLSMSIVLLLTAVNLLPTPTFLQYFSVTTPFLILQTMTILFLVWTWLKQPAIRLLYASLMLFGCVIYAAGGYYAFKDFAIDAPGKWEKSIANVVATSQYVDTINQQRRPVLADWSGYYVASASPAFHGLENNFGFDIAARVSPRIRKQCGLLHPDQLGHILRIDDLVVVVRDLKLSDILHRFGYVCIKTIGSNYIFVKKGPKPESLEAF